MNVYILYIDDEASVSYMNTALDSCKKFSKLNPILFQGIKGKSYIELCNDYRLRPSSMILKDIAASAGDTPINEIPDGTFSCTVSHFLIWNDIYKSGEPGVILEHDCVVKHDISDLKLEDGEVLFLGPRVLFNEDYDYPEDEEQTIIDVNRYEGMHAYAITPNTAKQLIDNVLAVELAESVDGMIAMRNKFGLQMRTLDPPPVVAVVGGRISFTENSAQPAFFNGINTPKFLKALKPGAYIPRERKPMFTQDWLSHREDELTDILDKVIDNPEDERSILVVGCYEGQSAIWLADQHLKHPTSTLIAVGGFVDTSKQHVNMYPVYDLYDQCALNISLSRNSDKIIVTGRESVEILPPMWQNSDIRFDIAYVDGNKGVKDVLFDCTASLNLLKDDGVIIVADYNWIPGSVKEALLFFEATAPVDKIHEGEYCVYRKCKK